MMFAEDNDNTLWFSAGGARAPVVGWLNTKKFLETGDDAASQGWTPFILDTNGNGKRDEGYVEPNQPVDPDQGQAHHRRPLRHRLRPERRHDLGLGAVGSPAASSTSSRATTRRRPRCRNITRCRSTSRRAAVNGFGPRGCDIDRNGVVWMPLASGHLASFDRKKCKGPLNGPTATGRHCPEGWTLYQFPGPQFEGVERAGRGAVELLHLGRPVRHVSGSARTCRSRPATCRIRCEALVDGKFVTLRVPYPMGFHAKGLDGRIDDPNMGWKGRGIWSTYAGRAPYPHRRRQGHDQQGGEIPAPARSAGAVIHLISPDHIRQKAEIDMGRKAIR